jgi:hypothetical protein
MRRIFKVPVTKITGYPFDIFYDDIYTVKWNWITGLSIQRRREPNFKRAVEFDWLPTHHEPFSF